MILGVLLVVNSKETLLNILGLFLVIFAIQKIFDSFQTDQIEETENQQDTILIDQLKFLIKGRSDIDKYSSILAAASVHIAKSDGRISEKEMEVIRYTILREFQDSIDEKLIAEVVTKTKANLQNVPVTEIFHSLINVVNLYYFYLQNTGWEARIELTSVLFVMIYEVALADGGISSVEEEIFNRLCHQFSIPGPFMQNLKKTAIYNTNVRTGRNYSNESRQQRSASSFESNSKLKNSLAILNLQDPFSLDDLEKTWKRLAIQYHPDKFHNAGAEVYERMHKKFIEAKEAYEFLKSSKS